MNFLFVLRVISYDPERLQFVADMRVSAQDPGSLYVLSSRFQRVFLRNLDTRDVNTRILKISGIIAPTGLPHAISPSISAYSVGPYNLGATIGYPTSPAAPLLYKTEIPIGTSRPVTSDIKSTFVDNYFSSIRQPYRYEPVGVINKGVKNPFTALNTGERPEIFAKPRPQYSAYQQIQQQHITNYHTQLPQQLSIDLSNYGLADSNNFLSKTNPGISDFNSIRRAKSVSANSTVLH